jgi:hypothetical protein
VIQLRRTFQVRAVDVPAFVASLAPLLQGLRDLKFDDDGVVESVDGRALEGLQVTHGTHPRPHTGYRVVTSRESSAPAEQSAELVDGREVQPAKYAPGWQRITLTSDGVRTTFTEYAAELLADDGSRFQLRAQEYGGSVEVVCTLPDPHRPTRLDVEFSGYVDEPWPMRGAVTGSATITLNQFPPAHEGKPQLNAKFLHRYAAGRLELTVTPDTDGRWLVTIDIHARFRGIFLLVTPLSGFLRGRLQQALDDIDPAAPAAFDEFMQATQQRFGPSPDPSTRAAAMMAALLAEVAEVVPQQDILA